jgi:HlyD family type I secretion membrane fusion protein
VSAVFDFATSERLLSLAALAAMLALPCLLFGRRPRQDLQDGRRDLGLREATRRQRLLGWTVILLFFGGGGTWAWLVPLASAAVAPGVVSPEGKRKTVQHLEGGIIRAIHVQPGSTVRAGDPLVTLEDVRARTEYAVLQDQLHALQASIARLEAEQAGRDRLVFPAELDALRGQPTVARLLADQEGLFQAHHTVRAGRRRITTQRMVQLEAENESLQQQIDAGTTQLELIGTEIAAVQKLVGKGLERMPRLLSLQRTEAQIRGENAALRGRIASNTEAIAQARLENLTTEQQERQVASHQLDETRKLLDEVRNRLPSSEDALARTVLRAPVEGEVVDLQATTIGGVVKPGEPILDILPARAELVIEAHLQPAAIKDVRRGLPARVVLTAYPQRNLPIIHGVVREVSADRLTDPRTGQPYFEAQVAVDAGELAGLDGEVALMSGMPAEVMIITGERTFLDYLLRPLYDSVRKSFRER